jgi:hypothetical protein
MTDAHDHVSIPRSAGRIHIIGGGTVFHVRPHLALSAVAYGGTARRLAALCASSEQPDLSVTLHLTRMARGGEGSLETPADIARLLDEVVTNPETRIVFMPVALCDYEGHVLDGETATASGKDQPRLQTRDGVVSLRLDPADKLIARVRSVRKDIFLVGFKTTAGATEDEQYESALRLLKRSHCNLVLANDVHTRRHMIVVPELARYAVTFDREQALRELVAMALARSRLSFSRTTLVDGPLVSWSDPRIPAALRTVVEHCVARGAYRPFEDVTVGHFAVRAGQHTLLSSRRRRNFNRVGDRDLVRVEFAGDRMTAYGARPSAGTRSQFAVLRTHPDFDCIVHFHCPQRVGSPVPVRSQREFECGSHECGQNTSDGMARFGPLAAVMLDRHGPNVIFRSDGDPKAVIDFIEANFDLSRATGDAVGE